MKAFDEWKLKRICKKSGRLKEYQDYLKAKETWNRDNEMFKNSINKAEIVLKGKTPDDPTYKSACDEVNRWKYTLEESRLKESFIRPNSPDDIQYREKLVDDFSSKIASILGDDDSIRFHGTPIYFTKEILKSGAILSSSARFDGYNKSTDLKDEISVSTAKTISRTLSFFTGIYSFQSSLPSGCLFVLKADDVDATLVQYSAMKTFSFKANPERLLGVCTTPENIPVVREWLKLYGYDENLAYSFEEFLKIAPSLKAVSEQKKTEDFSSSLDIEELLDELDDEVVAEYKNVDTNVKTR